MFQLLVPALTLIPIHSAWALDCAGGVIGSQPENEADGVPLDAVLVLHYAEPVADAVVSLRDAAGEVAVTWRGRGSALQIRPDQLLTPDTEYRIDVEMGWTLWTSTFQTGSERDDKAPKAPVIESTTRRYEVDGDWGEIAGLEVEIAAPEDDVFWRYEIAVQSDFSDAFTVVSSYSNPLLGHGLCETTFPDYAPDIDYFVRVRAVDQSNNMSEWVEIDSTDVNNEEFRCGVGCATLGLAPSSGGALGLLLLGSLARVRSRRARSSV